MPVSKGFVERLTLRLEAARPVRHRAMFGGLGLYLGECFFGIADDDKTFFKVDAKTVEAYEARGMGPWFLEGKPNEKYRQVPDDVLNDPDLLGEWIDASAAASERMKTKKPKKA